MSDTRILLTGGAGYLGSVAAHTLKARGFDVLIVDDLSAGHAEACGTIPLRKLCITDSKAVSEAFAAFKPHAVVHLAAVSDIGACERDSERARQVNVDATGSLLEIMKEHACKAFVLASSAAVYATKDLALKENDALAANSVYGNSKIEAEKITRAASHVHSVILRFFNIAGADIANQLGECHEPETHLIPNTIHALLHGSAIRLFGTDYPTPDGTAVRDYVHVLDAADAIVRAVDHSLAHSDSVTFNVGSGVARSVLEVINQASAMMQRQPNIDQQQRRAGDVTCLLADCTQLENTLGWKAAHSSLGEIIDSAIQWHQRKALAA